MVLLKVVSERKDKEGRPYLDLYLGWSDENGKCYIARVRPVFGCDTRRLHNLATECESIENFQKYI